MITTDDVKDYLRIPYADDDTFITSLITAGYDYLRDAVDDFDDIYKANTIFAGKADLWVETMYVPPAYERREGAYDGENEMNYASRAMLTQLQLYKKG